MARGLPELWVPAAAQVTWEPRSVSLQDLERVSERSAWRWTFLHSLLSSEQAESWFYSGSHPSWVREGKAIIWNELLDLVSKAEPVVPKQLEKLTRQPGQKHRTCQNVEKGEFELFVGTVGNVRANCSNLRVHGIHPFDRMCFDIINFYKYQILTHAGLMEPKLWHSPVWLA